MTRCHFLTNRYQHFSLSIIKFGEIKWNRITRHYVSGVMLKGSTERHGVTPRHRASQDHAELQHPVEAHRVKMPNVNLISKLSRTFAKRNSRLWITMAVELCSIKSFHHKRKFAVKLLRMRIFKLNLELCVKLMLAYKSNRLVSSTSLPKVLIKIIILGVKRRRKRLSNYRPWNDYEKDKRETKMLRRRQKWDTESR